MRWIGIVLVVLATQCFGIQTGWVVDDASIIEEDEGKSQIFFTVSISATSPEPLEVNFMTSNGTAKEGIDYVKTAGILTLKAGESSKIVVVPIINDRKNLVGDKYFYLTLTSNTLPLFKGKAKGIIIENDPQQPSRNNTKTTTKKGTL